ncbi:hypothetical protein [Erythrobacter alti]|uniref:hypothetical protein n=1 Tax=Erythrobacter alti TaxID=1896145 RepID=UPI0030F3BE9B
MTNPLVRKIVASVAGIIIAGIVVGLVEMLGHMVFPPPDGIDVTDPADQARMMEVIPTGAKVAVIVAWFLGSLAGAWAAIRIAGNAVPGWIVAVVMIALSLVTTQMFPHPFWMVLSALALPIVAVLVAKRMLAARLTS